MKVTSLLLSFLLLSCIIAPIRELVNKLYLTTSKKNRNNELALSNVNSIDMKTDFSRKYLISLSPNSSRGVFVISASSFMEYAEQTICLKWNKLIMERFIVSLYSIYS